MMLPFIAVHSTRIIVSQNLYKVVSKVRGIPDSRKPNSRRPYYRRVTLRIPQAFIDKRSGIIFCHPTIERQLRERFSA